MSTHSLHGELTVQLFSSCCFFGKSPPSRKNCSISRKLKFTRTLSTFFLLDAESAHDLVKFLLQRVDFLVHFVPNLILSLLHPFPSFGRFPLDYNFLGRGEDIVGHEPQGQARPCPLVGVQGQLLGGQHRVEEEDPCGAGQLDGNVPDGRAFKQASNKRFFLEIHSKGTKFVGTGCNFFVLVQ